MKVARPLAANQIARLADAAATIATAHGIDAVGGGALTGTSARRAEPLLRDALHVVAIVDNLTVSVATAGHTNTEIAYVTETVCKGAAHLAQRATTTIGSAAIDVGLVTVHRPIEAGRRHTGIGGRVANLGSGTLVVGQTTHTGATTVAHRATIIVTRRAHRDIRGAAASIFAGANAAVAVSTGAVTGARTLTVASAGASGRGGRNEASIGSCDQTTSRRDGDAHHDPPPVSCAEIVEIRQPHPYSTAYGTSAKGARVRSWTRPHGGTRARRWQGGLRPR